MAGHSVYAAAVNAMASVTGPDKWYFTKEQLENTPSRKCGYDGLRELSHRQQTANFIQDMGQRLKVTQLCINTAIVYMHRFYVFHSFTNFMWYQLAAAALFLAAKVEEQPRKLEHVIKAANICRNGGQVVDISVEKYKNQSQDLVFNENVLLQTLGFDVAIDHPHTYVVRCCHLVRASKDLAHSSYFLASNSLHLTTMCLQYKPTVVACFCIHLACKWSNWEIPLSNERKEWFLYVDPTVTAELLNQLTDEFFSIFESCPSRLKEKIMSIGDNGMHSSAAPINSPFDTPENTRRAITDGREHHRQSHDNRGEDAGKHGGRPSTSGGSSSSSHGQQHREQREREYREKKERDKMAAAAARAGSSGVAGPSGLSTSSSAAVAGPSSSSTQSSSSSSSQPPQSKSGVLHHHYRTSGGDGKMKPPHSSSRSSSVSSAHPRDILREATRDPTRESTVTFGIATKDYQPRSTTSSTSTTSSSNTSDVNSANTMSGAKDNQPQQQPPPPNNPGGKRDYLLKPNVAADTNNYYGDGGSSAKPVPSHRPSSSSGRSSLDPNNKNMVKHDLARRHHAASASERNSLPPPPAYHAAAASAGGKPPSTSGAQGNRVKSPFAAATAAEQRAVDSSKSVPKPNSAHHPKHHHHHHSSSQQQQQQQQHHHNNGSNNSNATITSLSSHQSHNAAIPPLPAHPKLDAKMERLSPAAPLHPGFAANTSSSAAARNEVPSKDGAATTTQPPAPSQQLQQRPPKTRSLFSPQEKSPEGPSLLSLDGMGSPLEMTPPKRSRNYSSSSEPELRPVMKKIDQVEGFETLMRDSSIGINRLTAQVPDHIVDVKDEMTIINAMKTPELIKPLSSSSSGAGGLGRNGSSSSASNNNSLQQPLVNGIETNPMLISSLLKETPAIPHLPAIYNATTNTAAASTNAAAATTATFANQSCANNHLEAATTTLKPQEPIVVVTESSKDASSSTNKDQSQHHHHKSKKKNKEKHKHKDKDRNKEERSEKKKKHKDKDRERHRHRDKSSSASSGTVVVVGGQTTAAVQQQAIAPEQAAAAPEQQAPIKIKIQKDKIQTIPPHPPSSSSSNNHSGPQTPLKIKISTKKDISTIEEGGTFKIKIPKEKLNNCTPAVISSLGADVTAANSSSGGSGGSSRKRPRTSPAIATGSPPAKMSRSSHQSGGSSSRDSKQNGRHSSTTTTTTNTASFIPPNNKVTQLGDGDASVHRYSESKYTNKNSSS